MPARLADRPATKTDLERVTFNMTPRAARALEIATQLTGDLKTDSINKAIQMYAYIQNVIADGGTILAHKPGDGDAPPRELVFF